MQSSAAPRVKHTETKDAREPVGRWRGIAGFSFRGSLSGGGIGWILGLFSKAGLVNQRLRDFFPVVFLVLVLNMMVLRWVKSRVVQVAWWFIMGLLALMVLSYWIPKV